MKTNQQHTKEVSLALDLLNEVATAAYMDGAIDFNEYQSCKNYISISEKDDTVFIKHRATMIKEAHADVLKTRAWEAENPSPFLFFLNDRKIPFNVRKLLSTLCLEGVDKVTEALDTITMDFLRLVSEANHEIEDSDIRNLEILKFLKDAIQWGVEINEVKSYREYGVKTKANENDADSIRVYGNPYMIGSAQEAA